VVRPAGVWMQTFSREKVTPMLFWVTRLKFLLSNFFRYKHVSFLEKVVFHPQ
jgi:hypothetical protein